MVRARVRRALALLGLVLTVLAAAGMRRRRGLVGSAAERRRPGGTLNVFAAASLTEAFTELADTYEPAHQGWKVRLNFPAPTQLAAQIEQGVDADVYAAASPKYPEELQGENLLGDTTDFATNTLVLIMPPDNPAGIKSAEDLTKRRQAGRRRPGRAGRRVHRDGAREPRASTSPTSTSSARSRTSRASLAKVELGEADAGFVYVTDAQGRGRQGEGVRAARRPPRRPPCTRSGSCRHQADRRRRSSGSTW